ncbi:hypothetical protein CRG98_020109, partial [Punica granatum]
AGLETIFPPLDELTQTQNNSEKGEAKREENAFDTTHNLARLGLERVDQNQHKQDEATGNVEDVGIQFIESVADRDGDAGNVGVFALPRRLLKRSFEGLLAAAFPIARLIPTGEQEGCTDCDCEDEAGDVDKLIPVAVLLLFVHGVGSNMLNFKKRIFYLSSKHLFHLCRHVRQRKHIKSAQLSSSPNPRAFFTLLSPPTSPRGNNSKGKGGNDKAYVKDGKAIFYGGRRIQSLSPNFGELLLELLVLGRHRCRGIFELNCLWLQIEAESHCQWKNGGWGSFDCSESCDVKAKRTTTSPFSSTSLFLSFVKFGARGLAGPTTAPVGSPATCNVANPD